MVTNGFAILLFSLGVLIYNRRLQVELPGPFGIGLWGMLHRLRSCSALLHGRDLCFDCGGLWSWLHVLYLLLGASSLLLGLYALLRGVGNRFCRG